MKSEFLGYADYVPYIVGDMFSSIDDYYPLIHEDDTLSSLYQALLFRLEELSHSPQADYIDEPKVAIFGTPKYIPDDGLCPVDGMM